MFPAQAQRGMKPEELIFDPALVIRLKEAEKLQVKLCPCQSELILLGWSTENYFWTLFRQANV